MPEPRPEVRKYDERMKRKQVMMPPHLVSYAQDKGEGNLSEGVRKCIERDMDQSTSDTDS